MTIKAYLSMSKKQPKITKFQPQIPECHKKFSLNLSCFNSNQNFKIDKTEKNRPVAFQISSEIWKITKKISLKSRKFTKIQTESSMTIKVAEKSKNLKTAQNLSRTMKNHQISAKISENSKIDTDMTIN